ncbi:hypothetical protein [Bacillus sp. B-jedd]|uniref:hypothetical protein n=1 Tax=Bacillus sp. B-jedd TaxID=1476857 RepID=UPI0005156917|nr:hypothetical protein [Bacillus sp. B-jedd]CEG27027.1 hypothetical protein BN1002_01883 [Bacillus sp. B-jedd]
MPVWAAAIGVAILVLFVLEEAANFFWKRYVYGKPERAPITQRSQRTHRSLARLVPKRVRESVLVERYILAPSRWTGRLLIRFLKRIRADRAYQFISGKAARMAVMLKAFAKKVFTRIVSFFKLVFAYPIKISKAGFEGAAGLIRKYRKSSSHS